MGMSDFAHPMSAVADVRDKVYAVERELHRKADSHEISSLRNLVDSLERTLGNLSSEVDGLRSELERRANKIEYLESIPLE